MFKIPKVLQHDALEDAELFVLQFSIFKALQEPFQALFLLWVEAATLALIRFIFKAFVKLSRHGDLEIRSVLPFLLLSIRAANQVSSLLIQ